MGNRCGGSGVVHESLLSLVMLRVCSGSDVGEGVGIKLDGSGSAHISLLLFLAEVVGTMLLHGAGANKLDVVVAVMLLLSSALLQLLLKTSFFAISHVGSAGVIAFGLGSKNFNSQYIEILSDQTLENSHSDILIIRILMFWEIE